MLCSYTRARGLRALQWELLLLQCSLQSPSIPVPAAASDRQLQEGLGGDGVCGETQGDRECQNQAVLWPSEGLSSQQVGLPKNRIPLEQNPPVLASRVSCIPGLLLRQAGWGQMAQPGPELLHRAGNISNVLMFPHSETIPKDPTEQGGGGDCWSPAASGCHQCPPSTFRSSQPTALSPPAHTALPSTNHPSSSTEPQTPQGLKQPHQCLRALLPHCQHSLRCCCASAPGQPQPQPLTVHTQRTVEVRGEGNTAPGLALKAGTGSSLSIPWLWVLPRCC